MKALTLTQPWATLMALGLKTIETRSWKTNYRGPLAIHAAKGFPKWAQALANDDFYPELALHLGDSRDMAKDLPRGVILCTVGLVDCMPTERLSNGLVDVRYGKVIISYDYTDELKYGDYDAGRWGWVTKNRRTLTEPIHVTGKQGLWNWNDSRPTTQPG